MDLTPERIKELSESLGLKGTELLNFLRDERQSERESRANEREKLELQKSIQDSNNEHLYKMKLAELQLARWIPSNS